MYPASLLHLVTGRTLGLNGGDLLGQLERERLLRKYDQEKAEGDRARAEHKARAEKDNLTTKIALVSLALFCAIAVIFNL